MGSCPILQAFDGKGSPNQHIYYFKSQTGNVVDYDAILACLFIGTLKGVTFERFMKLPEDSIKNWGDLKKLFLTRFFEDDSEVTMPTLLATKQRKGESVKAFVERFRNMALRCLSGMTQATLVETCHHNLQTSLLTQIGVAESRTWKQLVQQGDQAEEIIVRVRAEENKPRPEKSTRHAPEVSFQSKRKDTLATETKSPAKPQPTRGGVLQVVSTPRGGVNRCTANLMY